MENINFEDIKGAIHAAIDTLEALIEDLCGSDSNVTLIAYNSHRGCWEITFKEGEDQEFDTFDELYEWIKGDKSE